MLVIAASSTVDKSSRISTEQSDVLPTTHNRLLCSSEQIQYLQSVFDTELKTGHVSAEDVCEKIKTSETLHQTDGCTVHRRLRAEIHKWSLPLADSQLQPVSDVNTTPTVKTLTLLAHQLLVLQIFFPVSMNEKCTTV